MQAANPKNNAALSNLLASVLAVGGFLTVPYQPWFVGIPMSAAGCFLGVTSAIRHKKYQLTTADYWNEFEEFCTEGEEGLDPLLSWVGKRSQPLVQKYVVPKMPAIAATLLDAASAQKDDSWLTQQMIRASKFVLGAKGTGKSEWIRYEARRFRAENPNGVLRIVDIHYDADEPWLVGMGDESGYVASDAATGMAFIREMRAIGEQRIKDSEKSGVPYKLIIDEYQGFCDRSETDSEFVAKAVQFSQDELRKYQVNVTLTAKSIKEKQTGLDSSIISQMDLLALGNSLADATNKLPHDINAKELTAKRQAVAALPGCKYACVYRELGEEPQIKVIPEDLPQRSASITFAVLEDELTEDEIWLAGQSDRIAEMVATGLSRSKIYKQLGVSRGSGKRYMLVLNLLDSIAPQMPPSTRIDEPRTGSIPGTAASSGSENASGSLISEPSEA
jgi:hypothetical protein